MTAGDQFLPNIVLDCDEALDLDVWDTAMATSVDEQHAQPANLYLPADPGLSVNR